MGSVTVITIIALAASAVAGPLGTSGPCARQCTESSKFQYAPGTSYFFDYESDAVTTMQGASKEESRLHMKARVEIHAISKCDFVMRLSGVSLESSEPTNSKARRPIAAIDEFRQALERYTLRFSFQDGVVETVCPANGEATQVLNIKRGILSALQTSASSLESEERVIETDVSGKCTVNYQPLGRGWNSVTVRKVKDLGSCTERHSADTAIQMNPFLDSKETKSKPLVRGTQECQQVFKSNRLESAMCSESHVFRPFSQQDGGAITKISQALTFNSEKKTAFTGAEYSTLRKAMTFDHEQDPEERDRRTRQVEMTFIDLCTTAKDDIRPSVPGKFTTFVYGLRQLENTDIVNLYKRIERICPSNEKAKKMYLDGVTMAGTSGAIKFIVDQIQRGEMTEKEIDLWISTLAFVSKPDKDALAALLPLLDGKRLNAILPISALVNTYCRQNAECEIKNEVRQVVEKITELLGKSCEGDKKKVILALKALGNAGVSFEAERKLQTCAQNTNIDTELRVAAIQAYRRLSCNVMRSPIMDLYTDANENVEIRIAAFLNAMRCPSEAIMMKVKDTMESEKIKQVGSFVMSYLKNIQKTTPYRREVQDIISNVELLNKFESDIRKFSRNYQNSFFINSLDSGLAMDSNVIFDTTSYIPRGVSLNLTADIMGASINLFEIDARAEHFEKIIEGMFGPEGYFRKDSSKEYGREKKPISDNRIAQFDRKYDVKKNFEKDYSLSLDMKVFGNSLWYKKIQEGEVIPEEFSAMDIMVELAKEQQVELTKSFLFLDTTVQIPTASGMSLKLNVNGSVVTNLKMSGKVDAKNFQNLDVHGKIQPSGAIEIDTMMFVDAVHAKTGLKMKATMHTSTSLDGLVEIRDGKVFQARLNMPKDQLEIIDVQSRIYLVNGDEEREQKNVVEQNSMFSSCTGFTKKPLGVEACGELQLPTVGRKNAPLYPFSGPAKFRLFLRKTDPTLTHYNVEMKWSEDKNGREVVGQHLVMSFNTPESKVDREISAEFHLNKQDSTVFMKLKVPNKKIGLTGKRVMNENEKRVSVAVSVDDQEKFSVDASLQTDAIEGGIRYQPALEIRGPSSRLLNIRSTASMKDLKYSGELKVEDLTATPVVLLGEMTMGERSRYEVMAQIESYALSSKVKGHVQFRNGFSSRVNMQYRIMEGRKESLDINSKIRDLSSNSLTKYSGAASLQSSAMPEIATSLTWETQYTAGQIENSFDISLGDGRIKRIQKITMSEILKYQGSLEDNSVEANVRMTYLEKDIDFALQMNHKNTLESLVNKVNLKYAPGREASSSVDIKFNPRPLKMTSDIQLSYPGREMKLQSNVNQKERSVYEGTVTAQWQKGKQVRAVGEFRDSSTNKGRSYQATMEMTMPNTRPVSLEAQLQTIPGRYLISADGEYSRGAYGIKAEYTSPSVWNHRVMTMLKTPKSAYTAEGTLEKNDQTITSKIDVNVPGYRRVTGTTEVSVNSKVKTGAVDIMWDADRDQSRRVQVDAEYRLNAEGSQGKFNLKSPVKTMSGSYNANYVGQYKSGVMRGNLQAEVEWENRQKLALEYSGNLALKQSRRQVNGEIKITTPMNGYENLAMTVQHTDTLPEWNNKVVLQWKPNQKIVFGTEGKIRSDSTSSLLDASVRMNTPFSGYESMSLREVFEKRPSEMSSSSYVQWGTGKAIELSMSGALVGSNNLKAGVNFTSPFRAVRDISMSLNNVFSKDTIDADFDLRWNIRNSITVNFDGRNMMTGKKHTCSAELQFLSTIPKYEKMVTKVVYNKDTNAASLNGDLRMNNNRMSLGLNGVNKNSYYGYNMEGKMEYSSNYRNFEKGEIKLLHSSDSKKFSSNIESRLPYNHNLNLKLQGNMPSYREMDSSFDLASSFMEGVSYLVAYKLDGIRLAANGIANYGSQRITGDVIGTAQLGHRAWDVDYRINVNTPIRGYEAMKIILSQIRRELHFTTSFQASKNEDSVSVNHDMKIDDALNFVNNLRLTTPSSTLRSFEMNIRQEGRSGEYKHNTEAMWGNKKATLSAELNNKSQRRGHIWEARLNAKSPFQTLSSLDMEFQHEDDERNYKPKISMQWNDNNKISLDGSLKNNRFKKMETSLTLRSSFQGYENHMFSGKYDMTGKAKTGEISYRWSERSNKAVTVRGSIEADTKEGMVDVTATTPFRGLENGQLKTNYAFGENENSMNIVAQYADQKYTLNGKHVRTSNGNEASIQLSTPIREYEKFVASGSYTTGKNQLSTEGSYEWGNKKVSLNAEYMYRSGKLESKVGINTPFDGYRNMALRVEGNAQSPRKTGSVQVQWDSSKTIEATGAFESDLSRFGNVNIQLRTPFENAKELSFNGEVKNMKNEYAAESTLQWAPNKKITGNIVLKPVEVTVTFDTPFRPYKNVRFVANINDRERETLLSASVEWENTNRADISANYKLSDKTMEGKIEANFPANNKVQSYSAVGSIMNDNYKMMEGRVEIRTPDERYETTGMARLNRENKEVIVSFQGPKSKITLNGNVANKNFREIEGNLKMDSNMNKIPSFSVTGSYRNEDWKNIRVNAGLNNAHSFSGSYRNDDQTYQVEATIESPKMPSRRATISMNANTKNVRNLEGSASLETPSSRHTVTMSEKYTKRGFEAEIKANSPLIRHEQLTASVFFSNQKNKNIQGKVSIYENSMPHTMEFSYSNEDRDILGSMKIECNMIPTGKVNLEGKVSRPTDNTLETSFTAQIGSTRHSLVTSGKLMENIMELTATLNSPAVFPSAVTLTANLNNENYRNIDGSISLKSSTSESRVAFNMRRNGWKDLESFFTMNLPSQKFSMLRVDMKMRNDGLKSMEGSLDIKSSLESMRFVSLSGKMKNTDNAWDMSINCKLPVRKLDNVSLLATVHKNPELTRVSPRITLSIPNKKYVAYGNYERSSSNDLIASIGSEWDDNKSELSVEKHPNEYRAVLLTPIRGHERYSASANFRNDKGRRTAQIVVEDPMSRKYNADIVLSFNNIANFNGEANLRTPFSGIHDVSTKLRQTFRRGKWAMSFSHNMEQNKKVVLNIAHDTNPVSGTVEIVTPMEQMKSMKVSYNWQGSENAKVEVEMNNDKVLRVELEQAYQADTRSYSKNVQIQLPSFPYTLAVSSKPLPNGAELTIKSELPKRVVNFQTRYQRSSTQFSHGSQLTLDESTGQSYSYEIRSSPITRQGREIVARLDMPIRSLELRTTHEPTSTGRTLSGDFFWDASRDQTRHMKLTLEHTDNSNRYNMAHKLRLIAAHPQLSKDIVLSTECLLSPTEIYGKTEVEYSRYQQHNILLEARASSTPQNRRESRYVASLAAKHPVSNLDMQVTAEVANNQQEMAAEMKINYMDRDLHQQIQELRTKIQKVKKNIELMARSNENKINLSGHMMQQDDALVLALDQTLNNRAPVRSQIRWSQKDNNMELDLSTLNGDRLQMKASMPDDHIEAEIGHTVSGRQFTDGKFYLGLRNSKILESRINWRPEVYSEAQEGLTSAYERYMPTLMATMNGLQDEMGNEIESKSNTAMRSVYQETKPFITEISKEMKKLGVDSQRARNELYQMYRRNDFFVRTGAEYMGSTIDGIRRTFSDFAKYVSKKYQAFAEITSMTVDIMMNMMDEMVEDMIYLAKNYKKVAQRVMAKWGKYLSEIRREYFDILAQKMEAALYRLKTITSEYMDKLMNMVRRYAPAAERYWKSAVAEMKEIIEFIRERYSDQLKSVTEHPAYIALSEYVNRVAETLGQFQAKISYDKMVRSTRIFLSNGAENIASAYKYIKTHPNINYVSDAAANVFDQGRRIASELGMNTMIVTVLEELYQKSQQLAWNAVRDLADEYTNVSGNAHITYEPENGKIEIEMRLPVVKKSLKQLLDVNSYPQIQKLRELGSQISFGDFCIWDTYYKYRRYLDVSYWLPPFKAQAMIVGSQHYMTFDSFNFEFAGECSYLLARDFVDGNFTVTVNYARDNNRVVKKSLNIYTEGVKVEISRDNKVTVDDRKVELPQEIGRASVTMEDGVITVKSSQGYKVKCNFVHDICSLEVSGFYFGKTGGLFGNNNYEPALDMRTPEMNVVDSIEEFSNSWQVGSAQCSKTSNLAEITRVDPSAKDKCEQLFKNYNSEFRSGFGQVDPKPFLVMCINDLSPLREAEQKLKICSSAAAYVERCRQEGVNLNMPKQCVRCERMNADHMESGDVVKITRDEPVRAADIVFVVEEKDCNKNVASVLSKLAQSLDDGFRKSGYRQVHFAVVGFGGDGIHSNPHVVTSDSQVFGTVRNVDSALNSLPSGNGESNIFMALRYAAGLPFMTGSTKTFVLAKCSACKAEEMKADYSEMLRTMLDSDITLHLLMEHDFETRPPNKPEQAKRVLGFDRKHAYTVKEIKNTELRGDRDLLAQLKTPKDLCVPLALEVSGSFFSMGRLQDKKSANKKNIDVLSKRILKSAEPAECQICECIATQSGIGKSVCQRCVSPVVAKLVSDDFSPIIYGSDGMDNFVE